MRGEERQDLSGSRPGGSAGPGANTRQRLDRGDLGTVLAGPGAGGEERGPQQVYQGETEGSAWRVWA